MPYSDLLKLVVALVITLGLFFAMVVVMKKMQLGTGRGSRLISVLAAVPLGGKEKLFLIEVGGEQIVVGASPGQVNRIHVLKESIVVAGTGDNPAVRERAPFADILHSLRGGQSR